MTNLSELDEALTGRRRPTRQFEPIREAVVDSVDGDGVRFRLLDQPRIVYGPARWQRPITGVETNTSGDSTHTHDVVRDDPPSGTRCLVTFVGSGADRPWVIAFDGWPT